MKRRAAGFVLLLALPGAGLAQSPPDTPPEPVGGPVQSLPGIPGSRSTAPAQAATAAPAAPVNRAWALTPSITVGETWTDNIRLQADAFAASGWVANVTPGIRLDHAGPRLLVNFAFQHHRNYVHGNSELDNSQNYLSSFVTYALMPQRLWIESRAGITQENRSAFEAPVVAESPNQNPNRAETRTFSISPVARGRFGDFAEFGARFNESALRADGDIASKIDTSEVQATLRSAAPSAILGWAIDATALRSRSDAFGTLADRRARASLIYTPMPQLHFSLIHGVERTDFARDDDDGGGTPGAGMEWSPSPRTQFAAIAQRRFFGTGYLATLRHRTARTAWEIRGSRESTILSSALGSGAVTLDTLMSDLLAASIPDPFARGEAVRRRLAEFGSAPTSIGAGFLTERPYLSKGVDASVALLGVRNTATLRVYRRLSTALGAALVAGDSFELSENIRQQGYTLNWTSRLSRLTTASFASSRLKSVGLDSQGLSSSESLDTIYLTTQLGPRTSASFGVRRVEFQSSTATSYREKAVFGSISLTL